MNWTTIIKDCPKSFDLWFKHAGIAIHKDFILRTWTLPMEEYRSNEESVGYPLRDLYDFFDENGIVIWFSHNWGSGFLPAIRAKAGRGFSTFDFYDTRAEAEEVAFAKAFQLLEQKLAQPTQ